MRAFFIGGEDLDYSRRLSSHGYEQVVCFEATLKHRNKGDRRHKIYPSPLRHYYSVRSVLLRRNHLDSALWQILARNFGGIILDLSRPSPLQRICARTTGLIDGLLYKGGPKSYWFLR